MKEWKQILRGRRFSLLEAFYRSPYSFFFLFWLFTSTCLPPTWKKLSAKRLVQIWRFRHETELIWFVASVLASANIDYCHVRRVKKQIQSLSGSSPCLDSPDNLNPCVTTPNPSPWLVKVPPALTCNAHFVNRAWKPV